MNSKIKHVNIAVTNRCNLKCRQCSIWQEKPKQDISLENIRNIIRSGVLDDNVDIALTGGEPFFHKDLMRLVGLILEEKPACFRSISTNSTSRKAMEDLFNKYTKSLPGISLYISFDGINKHDEQRGRSLAAVIDNIKLIQRKFPGINMKLKFTITRMNYEDMMPTYRYARSNNLQLKVKLAENARNYTNKVFDGRASHFTGKMKNLIIKDLLVIYNDFKITNKKEAFFINKTMEFLAGKSKPAVCQTPFSRIFVMPDGEVYSCIHFNSIGNINNTSLDDIWHSKKAELIRRKVKEQGCCKCVSYHGFNAY